MDALKSMLVAVSTLRGQAERMRDVANDLALKLAGLQPEPGYDAPVPLFDAELGYDYREVYMPSHPAANERGYVPADAYVSYVAEASEAQRTYEANIEALEDVFAGACEEAREETGECDDEGFIVAYG
jgi:flagellar basal body rod protein FlgC